MKTSSVLEGKIPLANKMFLSKNDPNIAPDRIRSADHINQIVLHTTGWGVGHERLYKKHKEGRYTFHEFCEAYCEFQSRLEYNPHLTIAPNGVIYQFAPLKYRTHHTAASKRDAYLSGRWKKLASRPMDWWSERFPNLTSPLDFPAWLPIKVGRQSVYSINSHSIGIDLMPNVSEYTDIQYERLAELVAYLCHELDIEPSPTTIVDHSSITPIDRTTKNGPWDFANNFNRDLFFKLLSVEYALYRPHEDLPNKEDPLKSIKVMLCHLNWLELNDITDGVSEAEAEAIMLFLVKYNLLDKELLVELQEKIGSVFLEHT